jgi:hypothetical protein
LQQKKEFKLIIKLTRCKILFLRKHLESSLKKFVVFVMLMAVVLQGVNRWAIYIQFQLNREYIAKNLCVKKEVKNNCCQGSCQLSKRLGEQDDPKQNTGSTSSKQQHEQILYLDALQTIAFEYQLNKGQKSIFHYASNLPVGSKTSPFHPPIQLS